jgi:tetratricopeptide (TPR) repeat protein
MTSPGENSVVKKPARSVRVQRLLRVVLLLGGIVLVLGLGAWGWRWYTAPTPPEVPLADADPGLARAVEASRRKVRQQPFSAAAWGQLGQLLRSTEDYSEQAGICFTQAERLDPADPRWPYLHGEGLAQRDPDAAVPFLRRAVELGDRKDASQLAPRLRLAEVLLAKGQSQEAKAALQSALERSPEDPIVHLFLGVAFLPDDPAASRDQFLRCQDSPFTRQRACAQLAAIYQRLGEEAAAAELGQRAAALPPDAHWLDPFLAECMQLAVGKPSRFRNAEQLEAQGRLPEAVSQLRALLAESADYRAYVALGKDLGQLGDYRGAEEALQTAALLAPEKAQAHYYLARLSLGRAEQLRRQDNEDPEALAQLRAAASQARKVLVRKPDHAMAHMILGLSLKYLGQRAEALASLRTAVACGPELAYPHFYLGEMLAEDGQGAEARTHLEQAVRLAPPDDPQPRTALERLGGPGGKSN